MRSIRGKILLIVISFLIILCTAFIVYSQITTANYKRLRTEALVSRVLFESERLNRVIAVMEQDAAGLAAAGRAYHSYARDNALRGKSILLEMMPNFVQASGGGIWFEPFRFNPLKRRVGFYVSASPSRGLVYEPQRNSAEYDYHNQPWYRLGKAAALRRCQFRWSPPYYADETQAQMITVTAPICSAENVFLGLASLDWKMRSVVSELAKIRPTPGSFILLCAPEYGSILANTMLTAQGRAMTGRSLKTLPWYSGISDASQTEVLEKRFRIGGEEFYVFARRLNNGMIFSVQVPADEMFSLIEFSNMIFISLYVIFSLMMLYGAYWMVSRFINAPIKKLIREAMRLGQGGLSVRVPEDRQDEIGLLAKTFNKMADNLQEYVERSAREGAERQRIQGELELASQIQRNILPCVFPLFPELLHSLDLCAETRSAKEIGGDFYDFFRIGSDKLAFLIADVSGKGIPAALFMMRARTILKSFAMGGCEPHEVLARANDKLCEHNDACMFVTLFYAVYDLNTGTLDYVNGGHNPPFIRRNRGMYEPLPTDQGFALGVVPGKVCRTQRVRLSRNDRIFCYTDGVTEAVNSRRELFGEARLLDTLNSANFVLKPLNDKLRVMMDRLDAFTEGVPQADDITMLIFEARIL